MAHHHPICSECLQYFIANITYFILPTSMSKYSRKKYEFTVKLHELDFIPSHNTPRTALQRYAVRKWVLRESLCSSVPNLNDLLGFRDQKRDRHMDKFIACFVWLWKVVSHFEEITQITSVRTQSAEKEYPIHGQFRMQRYVTRNMVSYTIRTRTLRECSVSGMGNRGMQTEFWWENLLEKVYMEYGGDGRRA